MLLIVFRLLQGISFGGEFGTASTWVVEQAARSKYRAFWGAWVGFAIPIGLLLGFGSVILVRSTDDARAFTAWGWRIFFSSASWSRSSAYHPHADAGQFRLRAAQGEGGLLDYPAAGMARDAGRILRTSLVNAMFGGAFFLYFVFGTSYMKAVGFTEPKSETIGLIAAAFMLVFMVIGALLADRLNRRTVLLTAAVVFLIWALPYFALVNTGDSAAGGGRGDHRLRLRVRLRLWRDPDVLYREFPDPYASGASAGYQIAQAYGGGLIPILRGTPLF